MNNIKHYPKHVAVIPDWNRTWAKEKWFHKFVGHLNGFNKIVEIWKYIFSSTPIKVYTAWGLSTENLKNREPEELDYLFELYKKIPTDLFDILKKYEVNFRIAGSRKWLPQHLLDFLDQKQKELTFDTDKYMFLAINYWGQDEILRAMEKLCENKEEPTKENLEKYMDFWKVPPVNLIIRTKQKLAKRLSGFMLWRIWYAQLYFTDKYFPDFDVEEFKKALTWYDSVATTQNFWK